MAVRPQAAAMVATLACFALAGCGDDVAVGSPPPGCKYVDDQVCWQCGKPIADFNVMACRAKGDCFTFCGREHFPPGFSRCAYNGVNTSDELCKGIDVPMKGLFSGCEESPTGAYSCRSCFGQADAMVSYAIDAAGVCYIFANTCLPSDLRSLKPVDLEKECKVLPPEN